MECFMDCQEVGVPMDNLRMRFHIRTNWSVVQELYLNIDMKEEIKRNYWSNGQLRYEAPYLNGKIHGLAKFWYSDKQLMYEISHKNGLRHGLEKWWWSNRQLYYEVPYKNNLRHGAKIEFEY
jgi:antitoxin component YwqK of YwqJK toxin-antitoxin module